MDQEAALKQEVLHFLGRVMTCQEQYSLHTGKRQELTENLKRLGSKYILGAVTAEEVVDILCDLEHALRTGIEAEMAEAVNCLRMQLDLKEAPLQGEVCVIRPKKRRGPKVVIPPKDTH